MRFFGTDNIYMSSEREPDGGIEWNFTVSKESGIIELYMDGGIYLPFIHYELMSFPYNAGIVAQWVNNYQSMISSNIYFAGQWHSASYYENTYEMPGLYNYIEYNPHYMISISAHNDLYATIYNSINTLNSITDRQNISVQFFFPRRIALHINAEAGYMNMYNEGIASGLIEINPRISAGLTDNIGLFCSGSASSVSNSDMPYYYDDSFINEFFYKKMTLSGGITIIDIIADRIMMEYEYCKMDFVNIDTDVGMIPSFVNIDVFDNTDRKDIRHNISLMLSFSANNKPYRVSYLYENNVSTNEYYTYNAHYVSIGFDF